MLCLGLSPHLRAQTDDALADSLLSQARALQERGDADSSLLVLNQVLEIRSFSPTATIDQWAEAVNMQAVSYSMKYDWLKAIKTAFNAYRRLRADSKSQQYPITVYNLAKFHAGQGDVGDYAKAIHYTLVALDKFEKHTPLYFESLNNLVYYYILNADDDHAMDLVQKAIDSGREAFSDDRQRYVKELWSKAKSISELEKYTIAIEYANATLRLMEQDGLVNTRDYPRRLLNLAGYHYQLRDFASEIETLEKALPVLKEVTGEESREYVDCLRKLALAYNHIANENRDKKDKTAFNHYREQNEYYEDLSREILIRTDRLAEIRSYQIPLISNKAFDLFKQGKHDEALRYEKIAYTLYEMNADVRGKARSANSLATYYYEVHDLQNALKYAQESIQIYEQNAQGSRNKGLAYSNLSLFCHDLGRHQESIDYSLKAIRTLEQINDTLSDLYIKVLGNAGVYYHEAGDDQNALKYSTRSAYIQDAQLAAAQQSVSSAGTQVQKRGLFRKKKIVPVAVQAVRPTIDNSTVTVQWNRTVYSQSADEMRDAYSQTIRLQRQVFYQDFPSKSVEERRKEWEARRFVYDYAETLAFAQAGNDSLVAEAYNAILIQRGMGRYIQSLDSAAIAADWRSVAASLDSLTLSVTFFHVPTDNMGNAYSAILLRRGWGGPKALGQLFTDYDLRFLDYDGQPFPEVVKTPEGRQQIARDPRFARMFWTRILAAAGGAVNTIRYNHLTGVFTQIDPAALDIDPDTPLKNKYSLQKEE